MKPDPFYALERLIHWQLTKGQGLEGERPSFFVEDPYGQVVARSSREVYGELIVKLPELIQGCRASYKWLTGGKQGSLVDLTASLKALLEELQDLAIKYPTYKF